MKETGSYLEALRLAGMNIFKFRLPIANVDNKLGHWGTKSSNCCGETIGELILKNGEMG